MNGVLRWEDMTGAERLATKAICEGSLIGFVRIFFQLIQGQRFLRNWHHSYMCSQLESVYNGDCNRLIINIPPGGTKTELFSIHWTVWCIIQGVKNRHPTRWLPISYSDDLVKENSSRAREIIESEEFQSLWPMTRSSDTKGKSDWKYIDQNGNQHRMYGTSLQGQVTGRRAGFMLDGVFTGAIVLDDPLPPRDGAYGKKIDRSNVSLNRIVRSRLAHNDVPIVMIQQRIAKNDSTWFLMSDKAPDDYKLIKIPALIDREYVDSLPDEIRKECIDDTAFSGERTSYWPDKEPTEAIKKMEKSDPYLFNSQYQQEPDDAFHEGVIYRKEIETLIEDGRCLRIPVEPSLPAFTFWDIGINDDMAIWVMQPFRQELRLIAAYSNNNHGIEHYINWLDDFREKHDIRYQEHFGPHDLSVRDIQGKTRVQVAAEMGIEFTVVQRCRSKGESIEALRRLFPRICIDPERCQRGWLALKTYRREWDADNEVFRDKPVHDWASNYADALQQLGLSWIDQQPSVKSNRKKSAKRRSWKVA